LTSLSEAVEQSFEGMAWLRSADTAAMELARKYAARIDEALEYAEGQEVTKALYLGPHLLNTMRELGGSPQSRKAMQSSDPVGGALASIRASLPGGSGQDDAEALDSSTD
jgi:hypothetical protein